jgi:hypothetical protein
VVDPNLCDSDPSKRSEAGSPSPRPPIAMSDDPRSGSEGLDSEEQGDKGVRSTTSGESKNPMFIFLGEKDMLLSSMTGFVFERVTKRGISSSLSLVQVATS